jgi:RNA polymerase sigma factor (sigma-70 family)
MRLRKSFGEEAGRDGNVAPVTSVEDLYGQKFAPMVRFARLLVGSPEAAADIVQDAFVQVHRRWATIRFPEAYLRQAVVNGCRAHHRRRDVERRAPLVAAQPAPLAARELLDAVAKLRYRERAALVLRFYEDLPDTEIAEMLGCRVGSVASLVHRALARLRLEIEA